MNDLVGTYSKLREAGFELEAEKFWPVIAPVVRDRHVSGSQHALVEMWRSASVEFLPELDVHLAKALSSLPFSLEQRMAIVSQFQRLPDSRAVIAAAEKLTDAVGQGTLSPDDLAVLIRAGSQSTVLHGLRDRAEAALLQRNDGISTVCAVELLSCVSIGDPLWRTIRQQLLKAKDLKVALTLKVLRFMKNDDGKDARVRTHISTTFIRLLLTKQQFVKSIRRDLVTRNNEICDIWLREVAKEAAQFGPKLLGIFVHLGEVKPVKTEGEVSQYLGQIGKQLEASDSNPSAWTLPDLCNALDAMQTHRVVLPKTVAQLAKHVLNVHTQATEKCATEAAGSGGTAASDTNLGTVQKLMVSFWSKTHFLGVPDNDVTVAIKTFSGPGGGCRIDDADMMQCIVEVSKVDDEDAVTIWEGLIGRFRNEIERMKLVDIVKAMNSDSEVWVRELANEAERRFVGNDQTVIVTTLRRGSDFDDLVNMLSRLQGQDASCKKFGALVPKATQLLVNSMLSVVSSERQQGGERLAAATRLFAKAPLDDDRVTLESCVRCVHELGSENLKLPVVGNISFYLASMARGVLSFDVSARLWQMLGDAVAREEGDARTLPHALGARIWAFCLATQNARVTPSVATALRMLPNTHFVDELVRVMEKKWFFELSRDGCNVASLRATKALLTNEDSLDNYTIPGTPYVTDVALASLKVAIIVPRKQHRVGNELSGEGVLMERTLEILGWRTFWLWPGTSITLESLNVSP